MKNLKKLIILATFSMINYQVMASSEPEYGYIVPDQDAHEQRQTRQSSRQSRKIEKRQQRQADDRTKPTHQGFGRIGTALENTLTLHPGNAVNALATGDQSDTTFGWHENEEGRVKANRAHTEHNNNTYEDRNKHPRTSTRNNRTASIWYEEKSNKETKQPKTEGHWFWKKSVEESNE